MTPYIRNWIRCCSVGLAVIFFAWANLDTSLRPMVEPGTLVFHQTDWTGRLLEALLLTPFALLTGALWGAILGGLTLLAAHFARWRIKR